jgi:site-specific DNA-methyltransferase (adenine-specific)
LPTLDAGSVDSIVTDPPYGLAFMGHSWDHGVPGVEFWAAALRVAKPGAYLLAFGGTRTYHRLACAIEDAGWRMHDCIMWVYGSGFPKSKACLKPAWEPILVARKPGAVLPLQVAACRIGGPKPDTTRGMSKGEHLRGLHVEAMRVPDDGLGRWPANVIHDGSEEVLAGFPDVGLSSGGVNTPGVSMFGGIGNGVGATAGGFGDRGSAARFFYCAKASRADREAGLREAGLRRATGEWNGTGQPLSRVRNTHPTVKPTALMRHLCRLVTPPDGTVLDPFAGSGSTGKAAALEGLDFIGIEKEAVYIPIAEARIRHAEIAGPLFAEDAA